MINISIFSALVLIAVFVEESQSFREGQCEGWYLIKTFTTHLIDFQFFLIYIVTNSFIFYHSMCRCHQQIDQSIGQHRKGFS